MALIKNPGDMVLALFDALQKINEKPEPFQFYTADKLWTDPHIAQKMLEYHLDDSVDLSSRNSKFIDRSVQWMKERFGIGKGSKIADFGCGPGLYCARLAEIGADVTGIDFSEASIEYARRTAIDKKLEIDYILENYLEFETDEKFDLITMIFCDFCVLSPDQRRRMLQKFHNLLEEDGILFLDACSMNVFEDKEETAIYQRGLLDGFWSADDYYGFLNTFKYENEKIILDKYTIIEKSKIREIYNWLQCYSRDSITREFRENGFNIVDYYANVAGDPYRDDASEFAVAAQKTA